MQSFLNRSGALVCASFALSSLYAEASNNPPIYELETLTLSGGPPPRSISDFAQPIHVLDQDALAGKSDGSLGAILGWEPGVNASSFAAGASRPIIRGFDGPRVRILESGVEAMDASETSPDHGVALEPLLVERIEVLRGPATLRYGSSAIGGVVNVFGRDLPTTPGIGRPEGAVELRHETVSNGETALGHFKFGTEQWAISATGLSRDNDDYAVPRDADPSGTLENSFVETDAFSLGGTWFFSKSNYLGLSFSEYQSRYDIPGEEAVSIDLERQRWSSEFVAIDPIDAIEVFRLRFAYNDYTHSEIEPDGEIGTVFDRKGWELRAEATHHPIGFIDEGITGLQLNDADLSAVGHEAFTPPATTRNQAVFFTEHSEQGALRFEVGGRLERQTVRATGAESDYSDIALSFAASVIWKLDETNSLALALQRSQRHPTSTELYARGPHLATAQYEIGNPDLNLETAYTADLTFRSVHDRWQASVSIFYTDFKDYIFAENLGFLTDAEGIPEGAPGFDPGEGLDTYAFNAVDARFYGFEGEIDFTLYREDERKLTLGFMTDYVRAKNRDTNENLPRIPPLRVGSHLGYTNGTWNAGAELRYAFEQDDTAPGESSTAGYTEFNLELSKTFVTKTGPVWTLFVRANNLLDEEIRHHTSYLKDVAPLPARNFTFGGRFEF